MHHTNIRLPKHVVTTLKERAAREGCSYQQLLRMILVANIDAPIVLNKR